MGMLDRYRKKGGFVQLLNLLETTEKTKKEKFLAMIQEESAAWHQELLKKMISLDRVKSWSQENLMEILPRIPFQQVGIAIFNFQPEAKEKFLKALGNDRRKVEEMWKESVPNPAEISTCQNKILTEVRKMAQEGHLKLDLVDPELAIPDNIEEHLNSGGGGSFAVTSVSASFSAETLSKVAAEPPPPGLPPAISDELALLRKKVVLLAQENQKLSGQVQMLSTKLEQIRRIA